MKEKKISYFSIVENEWREQYDREWGLGIVVSVPQSDDGDVWVARILKDKDGYFIIPELVLRSIKWLKLTDFVIGDIPIKLTKQSK